MQRRIACYLKHGQDIFFFIVRRMPPRKTELPGSRYPDRGKIVIKMRIPGILTDEGKPVYYKENTGISDTKEGRVLAFQRHLKLYERFYLQGHTHIDEVIRRTDDVFEEFLKAKKRMPKTEVGYRSAYKAIMGDDNPMLTSGTVKEALLRYVNKTAKDRQHNAVTVRSYLRHFLAFQNYCIRHKLISSETKDVLIDRVPREPEREDTVAGRFTSEEAVAVLAACYKRDFEFGALNELMMTTGARPVDVLTLTWKQVKLDVPSVNWSNKITKRNEERVINARAAEILKKLRGLSPDSDKVFRWKHATISRLSRWFSQAIADAGVAKMEGERNRSMKSWRVVFRNSLHDMPAEMQRWLMRHKTLKVTSENYTYFTPKEQLESLEKLQKN